jgi:hypothetical protein
MDMTDWIVVVVGGLAGWGLVSLLAHLVRQQRRPPVDMYGGLPRQADPVARDTLSVAEIGNTWHRILGVPENASAKEIDEAYHLMIAECDRIRFSPTEPPEAQQLAALKRTRVNQAYEFIRPLRQAGNSP